MQINNQTAIISGGASGMGAETARHLQTLGARVAILDRNIEAAQKLAADINALAVSCDVTQADSVEKALLEVESKLGIPRICVNCAGIAPGKLIVDKEKSPMPLQDFAQVIQINLIGTLALRKANANRLSYPISS